MTDVLRFEQEFLDHLRHNTQVLQTITKTKLFGDDLRETTEQTLGELKQLLRTSEGTLLVKEEHIPIPGEATTQEAIVYEKWG